MYNQNYAYSQTPTNGLASAGMAGALITGAMCAAKQIRKVKAGEKTGNEAAMKVVKEGLGGGIALAAGAAVGRSLMHTGALGLVAMAAVSVGVKYAYDELTGQCLCAAEAAPLEEKPAKTAKAK